MKKYIFLLSVFFFIIPLNSEAQTIRKLEKQLKNASGLNEIKILDNLSEAYLDKDIEKSKSYAERALKKAKKISVPDYLYANLYNTLGAAYFYSGDYSESVKYYEYELKKTIHSSSKSEIAKAYYNIALIYDKSGNLRKAEKNFKKSIETAKAAKNNRLLIYNYKALTFLYEYSNRPEKALRYLKKYLSVKDKTFNMTQNVLRKKINTEKSLRTETEKVVKKLEKDTLKKAQEIEYLNVEKEIAEQLAQQEKEINEAKQKIQQAEIEKQKFRNYIMAGIIFVILIIGLIILRSFIQKKKMNKLLIDKNSEIQQQKEEIETQNGFLLQQKEEILTQKEELEFQKEIAEESNRQITSSINYASRIQFAMLHGESILEDTFNQYFILYKPRDIVSGDFYWIKKIRNYIVIVAADCTGHGVPGAFMSMLGISLLSEHVTSRHLDSPGEILDVLRKKIKVYLKQTGKFDETKDGMDMGLCLINTENLKAKYSGANNPMYLIRNKELTVFKPTRNPIGIYINEKPFENHTIQLEKNDSIYLFSDGYIDQFGGEKGGKLKSKKFKEILISASEKPMKNQKEILENTLTEWQGDYEQVDDILIMGVNI